MSCRPNWFAANEPTSTEFCKDLPLCTAAVRAVAIEVGLAGRDRLAGREGCRGAGPSRIFPLGFGRQSVSPARLARQPRHILLGVTPRDVDQRPPATAPSLILRVAVALATAVGDAGLHSTNVSSCLPTAKGLPDRHRVLRTLVGETHLLLPAGEPIMKPPAGTTTISGHSGQSLNDSVSGPWLHAAARVVRADRDLDPVARLRLQPGALCVGLRAQSACRNTVTWCIADNSAARSSVLS